MAWIWLNYGKKYPIENYLKSIIYSEHYESSFCLNFLSLYCYFFSVFFLDFWISYRKLLVSGDSGGMIVLVGQDGVQRPPIHFPRGGHFLTFLSCLENGLLPHGQLDPPLWSQRGKGQLIVFSFLCERIELIFYRKIYMNYVDVNSQIMFIVTAILCMMPSFCLKVCYV